jgi:hypothetical protein
MNGYSVIERLTSNLSFEESMSSGLGPEDDGGGGGGGGGSTTETSSRADLGARLRLTERHRLGEWVVKV